MANINGHITANLGGANLAGIRVRAWQGPTPYGSIPSSVVNGNYSLIGLNPGAYTVEFIDPNGYYLTQWYNAKTTQGTADAVTIVDYNTDVTGIDAAMVGGGQFSGTVTDQPGNPIQGIQVAAYSGSSEIAQTETAQDGTYLVQGLTSGTYQASFSDYSLRWLPQWYRFKPVQSVADSFSVTVENNTTGISGQLQRLFAKWTFTDLETSETASFRLNPSKGNEHTYSKKNSYSQMVAGQPVLYYDQDEQGKSEIEGNIFSQADLIFFNHWFSKEGPIVLTDDLGRNKLVLFESYTPQRVRKAADPWFHTFKLSFLTVSKFDL